MRSSTGLTSFGFLAKSLVRRKDFIPVLIGLLHRLHLLLMHDAVGMAGFAAETFGRCAGSEEPPQAAHEINLRGASEGRYPGSSQ